MYVVARKWSQMLNLYPLWSLLVAQLDIYQFCFSVMSKEELYGFPIHNGFLTRSRMSIFQNSFPFQRVWKQLMSHFSKQNKTHMNILKFQDSKHNISDVYWLSQIIFEFFCFKPCKYSWPFKPDSGVSFGLEDGLRTILRFCLFPRSLSAGHKCKKTRTQPTSADSLCLPGADRSTPSLRGLGSPWKGNVLPGWR